MAEKVEFDERIYDVLLKTFETELNAGLKDYYVWKFNSKILDNPIINPKLKTEILSIEDVVGNIPKRTFILKNSLQENMKKLNADDKKLLDYAYWIIQDWGGIRKYKRNRKNDDRIKDVKKCVDCGRYDISFDVISSLSKVASFLRGNDYAVYDSRVIFTLNWLIFINGLHEQENPKGKMKFFQQPDTQNSNIKEHCQNTIFCLAYRKFDSVDTLYYTEEESYEVYCELLKSTCEYYKKNKTKYTEIDEKESDVPKVTIGAIEMCLFSIAAKNKKLSKNKITCNYDDREGNNEKDCYITNQMDRILRDPIVKALKEERKRLLSKWMVPNK